MVLSRVDQYLENVNHDLMETVNYGPVELPYGCSHLYCYLNSIGKKGSDYGTELMQESYSFYKKSLSHRGFLMVTYGDIDVGRVKGVELATFIYSPRSYYGCGVLLDFIGRGYTQMFHDCTDQSLIIGEKGTPEYIEFSDCCDSIQNWFLTVNKARLRELFIESDKLSTSKVLRCVNYYLYGVKIFGLQTIYRLFKELFPEKLHFYHIDLGKDLIEEYHESYFTRRK